MNLLDSHILAYFEGLVDGWGDPRHNRHVRIQSVFDRNDKITAGDVYDLVDAVRVLRQEERDRALYDAGQAWNRAGHREEEVSKSAEL